jgi:uncharacterized membrane protein
MLVGTPIYLAGGWRWSAVLLSFFASSSALSRLEARTPSHQPNTGDNGGLPLTSALGQDDDPPGGSAIATIAARGSRRDIVQALANGGVAAALALAATARPSDRLAAGFAGALAAANADTWATEIGGLSRTPPRHILTGAEVPTGTSGGVTRIGLAGAAAGGALIGGAAAALLGSPGARPAGTRLPATLRRGLAVGLAGFAGSLVDSAAGATLQAAYRCPRCGLPTERRVHPCGAATVLTRGLPWCTNDVVNVLCTAAGALVAAAGQGSQMA